jgi:hypothetical protein
MAVVYHCLTAYGRCYLTFGRWGTLAGPTWRWLWLSGTFGCMFNQFAAELHIIVFQRGTTVTGCFNKLFPTCTPTMAKLQFIHTLRKGIYRQLLVWTCIVSNLMRWSCPLNVRKEHVWAPAHRLPPLVIFTSCLDHERLSCNSASTAPGLIKRGNLYLLSVLVNSGAFLKQIGGVLSQDQLLNEHYKL